MIRLIAVLLLTLVVGCGYQVPGREASLPEGVESIYLPLFANRTTKPGLENHLTDSIYEVLARIPSVRLVSDRASADTLVNGTIRSYGTSAIGYDANDRIREYSSKMTVEIELRRVEDGKLLWQDRFVRQEPFQVNADKMVQNDQEDTAIREIDRRLADDFQFRLMSEF